MYMFGSPKYSSTVSPGRKRRETNVSNAKIYICVCVCVCVVSFYHIY